MPNWSKRKPVFPLRLEELRHKRDWSQEQVAEKMGITKGTVSRHEHGENLSLSSMIDYATLYNVHVAELFANVNVCTGIEEDLCIAMRQSSKETLDSILVLLKSGQVATTSKEPAKPTNSRSLAKNGRKIESPTKEMTG